MSDMIKGTKQFNSCLTLQKKNPFENSLKQVVLSTILTISEFVFHLKELGHSNYILLQ
jgi:hypothetical protein